MNYNQFVELDNLTLRDCCGLHDNEGLEIIINDGKIVNLVKAE